MKIQGINIARARINGLNNPPYYFSHKCYYAWDITFTDSSILFFENLTFIRVGDYKEEAESFCNQLKEHFKEAHIYEGDEVAVIFNDNGYVIAIGSLCSDEGLWIDVTDCFVKKPFKDLNIVVTSLKVYL